MTWITENPIPLFILGLIAQIILGIALWQTGRGWIVWVMIALALVSIGLIGAEIVLISPKEEVTDTLDELAAALETNDHSKVLAFIAPEASAMRADAARRLKEVKISEATVTGNLQIKFDPPPDPSKPIATATFIGRFKAKLLKETTPYDNALLRFKVHFRKENGKWLVTGYDLNNT